MDAIQRAIPVPQAEVIMHGASGRQVLGKVAPLAAGTQNIHHAVDHRADIDAPFTAAALARWNERLDKRPFRIAQVARISQIVTVVAGAVLGSPHGAPHETIRFRKGNHNQFRNSRKRTGQPIHPTH
jgi:hypothetical protein